MKPSAPPARGEAPGRLDVLGGVADYSGALVLQMPIARRTRVTITTTATRSLALHSAQEGTFEIPLSRLRRTACGKCGLETVRAFFAAEAVPAWARYVLGCLVLHARAFRWWPTTGLDLHIDSGVPASMGVSSSAALEVATLRALVAFTGHTYAGTALARTAQRAENEIVGAPCGLMDQLASAHGVRGSLLPILCRPDQLATPVRLPSGWIVVGWPSGVKHAVAASPYATARAAAFMGKRLAEAALGRPLAHATSLHPSELRAFSSQQLPAQMRGADFLAHFGPPDDPLSVVDPARRYPVRAALTFPVEEHLRTTTAAALLRARAPEAAEILGEFMAQSHAGYSAMGLGSPETDRMVRAVRELGLDRGFAGARVSGGGCGGTVVVLLRREARPALEALARDLVFQPAGPLPLVD